MVCLETAQAMTTQHPSLLLHHPQRSASWSCPLRCCPGLVLRLCMLRSWKCGPVFQLCLLYKWAYRNRKLYRKVNPHHHHLRVCLKRPHSHLHLCHSLTLWQISQQCRVTMCQTPLPPQQSCLHLLGKRFSRCLLNPSQSCEYLPCPRVSACWRWARKPWVMCLLFYFGGNPSPSFL